MGDRFVAQTLVETDISGDRRRLEMTFVNAEGQRQTLSLPVAIAADLVPVLKSLASNSNGPGRAEFTKLPKQLGVASARHERLVLVRFDDDPPYGLELEEAENLWRGLRKEAATVSQMRAPQRQ